MPPSSDICPLKEHIVLSGLSVLSVLSKAGAKWQAPNDAHAHASQLVFHVQHSMHCSVLVGPSAVVIDVQATSTSQSWSWPSPRRLKWLWAANGNKGQINSCGPIPGGWSFPCSPSIRRIGHICAREPYPAWRMGPTAKTHRPLAWPVCGSRYTFRVKGSYKTQVALGWQARRSTMPIEHCALQL